MDSLSSGVTLVASSMMHLISNPSQPPSAELCRLSSSFHFACRLDYKEFGLRSWGQDGRQAPTLPWCGV